MMAPVRPANPTKYESYFDVRCIAFTFKCSFLSNFSKIIMAYTVMKQTPDITLKKATRMAIQADPLLSRSVNVCQTEVVLFVFSC